MQHFYHEYLSSYLPHILAAIIILLCGFIAASLMRRVLNHGIKLKNHAVPKTFLSNLIYVAILLITLIMALSKIGVPTATLITVLGAGSLAIGLALKDFLSNIAAGFMIAFLRPFDIDDHVIVNNISGYIVNINLFMTQLKTATNECVFIPNNNIIGNAIINQSFYNIRRLDLEIGVDYASDLKLARKILEEILASADYVIKNEASLVGVTNLADSAIIILVRFWSSTVNYTVAKHQFLETVKQRFTEANISLPFPQLDVHVKNSSGVTSNESAFNR